MSDLKRSLGCEEEAWTPDLVPTRLHQKQYQCPQCPSSFKRPENLKRHQRGQHDNRKFTCQICDKSFARSDILGRHAAIHVSRERQNDNPQRRRACCECARARERCSRGEPCRRCAIKALCCVYPEEPPPKLILPPTWQPSTSESNEYCATRASSPSPESLSGNFYTGIDTRFRDSGSSRWQAGGSSVSCGGSSILPPSISYPTDFHTFQDSQHESYFTSSSEYGISSPQNRELYAEPASETDNTNLVTNNYPLEGAPGVYGQASNIPSNLMANPNQLGFYQNDLSSEFQTNYAHRPPHQGSHPTSPFDMSQAHSSNMGTPAEIAGQYAMLDFPRIPASHKDPTGIDFDPLQTPYFHPTEKKTYYDFTANPLTEPCHGDD
ncbi:hypothetical protein F4802DRAFT_518451 [Xylaria palmicola]|nr:hypothetical protein F4802DRAFT_518451 [Xylaria palmicola]